MLISRVSRLSGLAHEREIDVTQEQIDLWKGGEFIQVAMPKLSLAEREFLMTGTTQEEWDNAFKEDEDVDTDKTGG